MSLCIIIASNEALRRKEKIIYIYIYIYIYIIRLYMSELSKKEDFLNIFLAIITAQRKNTQIHCSGHNLG